MLHCQHIFCEECVATWFDRDTTCPMCRSDEWTFSIDFRVDRTDESVLREVDLVLDWIFPLVQGKSVWRSKLERRSNKPVHSTVLVEHLKFLKDVCWIPNHKFMSCIFYFHFYDCFHSQSELRQTLAAKKLWLKVKCLIQRRRVSKRPQAAHKAKVKVHCADSSRIVPY